MARTAKKEKALTPEEKLAQALVPDVEQPYRVPDNWGWVYLSGLLREIKNGTTIKQNKSGIGYSVTRIESLQNQTIDFDRLGTIVDSEAIKETDWYIAGDIALSHINSAEHVGKTALITEGMLPLVHGMNLLRLRFFNALIPQFFQYYSQTFQYKEQIRARINMAVNQVSINQKQIGSIEFPLPPLTEQQRIVDRIESLFAKLDEAKEKAQTVVDGFEDRKAAIMHKAFTGELTAEWRDANHVDFATWKEMPIGNAITAVKDKYDPEKAQLLDVPYIGLEHFEKGNGIIGKGNATDVKSLKTLFLKGDILYGKLRPYLDKHDVAPFDGMCSTDILVYRAERNNSAFFFNYLMSQPDFIRYANSTAKGINLPRTSEKEISAYKIKLPLPEEQERIVQMVDVLLGAEKQAKEAAEHVIDQIDAMKKSILARAFRGELGTNDPNDESAVELLKRVLREDQSSEHAPKSARKRTIIPKEIEAQLSTGLERDIIKLFIKANDTIASMNSIMALSSKKFEVLDALRTLETRKLIQKNGDGTYSLLK